MIYIECFTMIYLEWKFKLFLRANKLDLGLDQLVVIIYLAAHLSGVRGSGRIREINLTGWATWISIFYLFGIPITSYTWIIYVLSVWAVRKSGRVLEIRKSGRAKAI